MSKAPRIHLKKRRCYACKRACTKLLNRTWLHGNRQVSKSVCYRCEGTMSVQGFTFIFEYDKIGNAHGT